MLLRSTIRFYLLIHNQPASILCTQQNPATPPPHPEISNTRQLHPLQPSHFVLDNPNVHPKLPQCHPPKSPLHGVPVPLASSPPPASTPKPHSLNHDILQIVEKASAPTIAHEMAQRDSSADINQNRHQQPQPDPQLGQLDKLFERWDRAVET